MNKAILIGNLTKDVELRNTPSGKTVGSVTIATNEQTTDSAGNKIKQATFHNLVIWNKAAEIIAQYCKKGSKLYVEGKIVNRSYDAPDGTKRYVSEVLVKEFEFLDSAKSVATAAPSQEEPQEPEEEEIRVDNIPF
jgi:single-strand DNA-binding protein